MDISIGSMLVTISLYGVCVAFTIWLLRRLRERAEKSAPMRGWREARQLAGHILLLAVLPVGVSVIVLWLPHITYTALGGEGTLRSDVAQVFRFFMAQLIWSLPSACLYVLAMRILKEQFSVWRMFAAGVATLLLTALVALFTGWSLPTESAPLIAQLLGGILPMSSAAGSSNVYALNVAPTSMAIDWHDISLLRAATLSVLVCTAFGALRWRAEKRRA